MLLVLTTFSHNLIDLNASNVTENSSLYSQNQTIRTMLNITLPILLIAMIIGCAGNAFVCWIIRNKREFHTPTFYLMMNMAISDCIMLLASSIMLINDIALMTFKTTQFQISFTLLCKLLPVLILTSYVSSSVTLAAISVERYWSVTARSQQGSLLNTRKKLQIIIIISWLLGFLITSPFFGIVTVPQRFPWICTIKNINIVFSSAYFLTLTLIAYVLPAITVVTMYVKIILFLRHSFNDKRQCKQQKYYANRKRHIRMVFMFILLTGTFLLFSSFLFSLFLLMAFSGKGVDQHLVSQNPRSAILAELGFLLTVVSCLQNPILYFAFNPSFRQILYFKFRECCSNLRPKLKLGMVIEPAPNIEVYGIASHQK